MTRNEVSLAMQNWHRLFSHLGAEGLTNYDGISYFLTVPLHRGLFELVSKDGELEIRYPDRGTKISRRVPWPQTPDEHRSLTRRLVGLYRKIVRDDANAHVLYSKEQDRKILNWLDAHPDTHPADPTP